MIATRYAPFGVLTAAMLVLVIVAPSRATPTASAFPYLGTGGSSNGGGAATLPGTGPSGQASAGVLPGGPTAAPAAGQTTAHGPLSFASLPPGDTSHCVNGRQFGELKTAPPCTPKWAGNNGGSTWAGVTKDSIEVVYYREKDNPAVAAIEQGAGLYSNPTDQQAFIAAANTFINNHYELYGRKIHLDFYQGNCSPSPPDPACYRSDADAVVAARHPFAVIYDNNTNSPDFFDELSRQQTLNWGGWHFGDNFDSQHRPWHWDVYMSGDYQAELTGEYWCNRLAGKPARFAGDAALQVATRKVAIVVPNYPTTIEPADHLQSIINGCAPNSAEIVAYSSDTSTATAQATNDVAKERQDGVTSLLWFSDPIAPVYGTDAESSQNYHPEEVLVGSGLLDYDVLAQLYSSDEWKHAFGPSDIQDPPSFDKTDAAIVWRSAGRTGNPYSSANLPWSYFSSVAYILNQTGPTLNPGTFERAAFAGPWSDPWMQSHDASHPYVKWGPNPGAVGAYAGISDEREVYWDPNAISPINNKAGAYVTLDDHARYRLTQWPRGDPALPPGV